MREPKLVQLEEDLQRVPGVRNARVVGVDTPSEIHIVSTPERSPKQVVRDVQSLASAGFGLTIDHRIVSVVQLADAEAAAEADQQAAQAEAQPPAPDDDDRPVLESVVLATKGASGWVKVTLRWPGGETTEGAGATTSSREARARGATIALLRALEPSLAARAAKLDVEQVLIHRIGSGECVLVRGLYSEAGKNTPVVGSALIHDDVATAAVHALLHAINRKLQTR
ncbi:MAG TPA: hypothetical protein VIG64_08280 [Actinomycetota bacterium]|jgi:hypothetical protein